MTEFKANENKGDCQGGIIPCEVGLRKERVMFCFGVNSKQGEGKEIMNSDGDIAWIRRIENWSNAFSCEVLALIRRISLVGYGVLVKFQQSSNIIVLALNYAPFSLYCLSTSRGNEVHTLSSRSSKGTDGAMVPAGEPPSISSTTMDRKPRLTGGINDSYIRHMLLRARNKGWHVVVFNSRGCGNGPVTTPQALDFKSEPCSRVTMEPENIITIPHDIISEILRRLLAKSLGHSSNLE
ncbi:hypothetical protein Tco_1222474 [Tanacetum coccineum]